MIDIDNFFNNDDIMTSLLKKLSKSIKKIDVIKRYEFVWSVSKLSTESVGSRRELVANNIVFTPPTRRNSTISLHRRRRCVLGINV